MKTFNDENFCLDNETAKELYHNYAKAMPIIDYHCHLDPKQIYEDKNFNTISEAWLAGDHYKWRAMRTNGISEELITGNTSDWEKFEKWAETVPATVRNPLYHWTHLELKSAFDITDILSPKTAKEIYEKCNAKLQSPDFSPRGIQKHYNVKMVCTTDDPIDNLEYHIAHKMDKPFTKMLPTWRPDKAMAIDKDTFKAYIESLAKVSNTTISSYDELISALKIRHDYFHEVGCRLSDHGIEDFFAEDYTTEEVDAIFKKALQGEKISEAEIRQFKSAVLHDLALMNHSKNWVQQFHYGAIRNNNTRLFKQLGPDTGFDSIHNGASAAKMSHFFDLLDYDNQLAKTIIYNLNPCDNE
nr:glucuronate isomerase [Bacteroidales bacterium]